MATKSKTCIGKATGKPLTEYESEREAEEGAHHVHMKYGRNPKDSYRNQTEAQRRADILRKEQGAELRVYACEHKHGWHLTKGHGR